MQHAVLCGDGTCGKIDSLTIAIDTITVTKRTSEEMEEEIITLYRGGMSPYKIAQYYHGTITHGGVRNVLLRAGEKTRNRSEVKQRYDVDLAKLVHLYLDEGWSTYRIGKELDIPPSVVWLRLHKAGIKTRDIHEARSGDE
jgi:hypothetical protein